MSQYTPALLKDALGSKYDPDADYILLTHRVAANRVATESNLKIVGKVPDFTNTEIGTMIVVERTKPEPKKPSLLGKLIGSKPR